MMAWWYDRDGNPIETTDEDGNILIEPLTYIDNLLKDYDYRVVAVTEVSSYRVSTVWLGVDHSFGRGEPLIFETMIFGSGEMPFDEWCWRYPTEEESLRAHGAIVRALREGREPEWGDQ